MQESEMRMEDGNLTYDSSDKRSYFSLCLLTSAFLLVSPSVGGGLRVIEVNDLSSRGLFEHELIIAEWLVHVQLHDAERDVVLLLRPDDLDSRRKQHLAVILVIGVSDVGDQRAILVVDQLPVRQKINPAEDDFA